MLKKEYAFSIEVYEKDYDLILPQLILLSSSQNGW